MTQPPPEDHEGLAAEDAAQMRLVEAARAFERTAPLLGSFLGSALAGMRARADGKRQPIPIPHLPSVQAALAGGVYPGVHVLVGNTGSGKSQFALQLSLEAARAGAPVLYVGLELGRVDLAARMLGLASHKRWSRLYLGEDRAELDEVAAAWQEHLAELPLRLAIAPPFGWSHEDLTAQIEQLCSRYPVGDGPPPLVVVDFMQLVTSPKGEYGEPLRERIGRLAYAARAAAREHGVAVLLVSSTARVNYAQLYGEQEGKNGKKPPPPPWERRPEVLVGLGKESGEVEYAADSVLVLVAEPRGAGDEKTRMHLAVAKLRFGPSSWVHDLEFDGGRFSETKPDFVLPNQ